ncbi:MAG TPA: zinc metalloprotease HtpX [Bryobacteraceae bacterium]|jgi:heat shock protein HtpX|nr:zinc metalloprotease HtpX [Bryobacteraceae bacterium]
MNALKTAILLGLLSAILLVAGEALGGRQGLLIALVLAAVMNFTGYFFSDRIALATYSAQPVTPTENSEIYARVYPVVHGLAMRMGIPMPKLWVIPQDAPNAFATGRNPQHASVAFTVGILQLMNDQELEAVIAHELGHVLHRDILISSVAATIAAAITYLGHMAFFMGGGRRDDREEGGSPVGALFMMILAPIAAAFIQMAISRSREFSADEASAKYTNRPDYLISALRKLEAWNRRIPMDADPATAHMFIVKPFTGESLMNLFSTHPSTEKRIARLEAMLR